MNSTNINDIKIAIDKKVNLLSPLPFINDGDQNTPDSKHQKEQDMLLHSRTNKRGGWWDTPESKKDEMDKVKLILRNQTIYNSRPNTEESKASSNTASTLKAHHLNPLSDRRVKIEQDRDGSVAPAAENEKKNSKPKSARKVKPPWHYDPEPEDMDRKNAKIKPIVLDDKVGFEGPFVKPTAKSQIELNELINLKKDFKRATSTLNSIKNIIVTYILYRMILLINQKSTLLL
jgi:hypothetical protein